MAQQAENRSCLHLVARSSQDVIKRCEAFAGVQDEVLFLDDGVMCLCNDSRQPGVNADSAFLSVDLQARGLLGVARKLNVRIVSDQDFVNMLRQHDVCLTWK
jgi:sulfur relay protein TusB/DsrH